jgi:RHS repeat-associated protein
MYRLSGMTTSAGATVVNGVTYNAANQLLTMDYPSANESRSYNILNQLTQIYAATVNNVVVENLAYAYPTGTNNGKISSMYNAISGETVTYTYDSLNRLATAAGSGWGEAYTFDGFGNLNAKTVTSGSGPSLSLTTNPANNQMDGIYETSYDANGNVLGNATGIGAYDAENRISSAGFSSGISYYGYDAQNRRTFLWPGTRDTFGDSNPTGYSVVLYSPTGQKLGTYQINTYNSSANNIVLSMCSTLMSSDQYFGGRRLAAIDQLGSAGTYYPWGENKGTTNPQNTWGFGTYWQDSATSLDYAKNRYYSNAYGRFMTPDPYQASGGPSDPGSWNRYAYTRGDPVNRNDSGGLCDSDDPSCVSECDPADPICVIANECDPADASCSLESVSYGGSGGYPYVPITVTLQLDPTQLLTLVEDGFLQANPATIQEIEEGVSEAITLGAAGLAALGQWAQHFFAKSTWMAGSFPTVAEVQANCTPVGNPVKVDSTRRGNRDGGTSVEQEYLCPDGKNYTIHTLFDKNGNMIGQPHVRPGAPKYGR